MNPMQNGMAARHSRERAGVLMTGTAVVVLKSKYGGTGDTLRMRGLECRHEPERRRLVLHRNGTDVAKFDTDQVERWWMDWTGSS